jgi:hypothetical protein
MNLVQVFDAATGQLDFDQSLPDHAKSALVLAEVMREKYYWVPNDQSIRGVVEAVGVLLDAAGNILQGPIVALCR